MGLILSFKKHEAVRITNDGNSIDLMVEDFFSDLGGTRVKLRATGHILGDFIVGSKYCTIIPGLEVCVAVGQPNSRNQVRLDYKADRSYKILRMELIQ